MDLTVRDADTQWNILIEFSKQIGNSFAKIINTKVNFVKRLRWSFSCKSLLA